MANTEHTLIPSLPHAWVEEGKWRYHIVTSSWSRQTLASFPLLHHSYHHLWYKWPYCKQQ